jgi:hypothetical protein
MKTDGILRLWSVEETELLKLKKANKNRRILK